MIKIKPLKKILEPLASFIDWLNDNAVKKENQRKSSGNSDSQRIENSNVKEPAEEKNVNGVKLESSEQIESIGDHTVQQSDLQDIRKQAVSEGAAEKLSEDKASDFLLDVPNLNIQEIKMHVDNLTGSVGLRADLANLIKIDIGAQVDIAKVDLDLKGVEAQAACKVRLKHVYSIFTRALETIDKNPEIFQNLFKPDQSGAGVRDGEKTAGVQGGSENKEQSPSNINSVQGIKAQKGELENSIRNISQDIGKSVGVSGNVSEKKREKMVRIDKV